MRTPTFPLTVLAACVGIAACAPAGTAPAPLAPGAVRPRPSDLATAPSLAAAKVVEPRVDEALAALPATEVSGWVQLGGPVIGARVEAFDASGTRVGGPVSTNAHGLFVLPAAGLPSAITLVATGGQIGVRPMTDRLQAVIRPLNAATALVDMGVPSTIAAARAAGDPRTPEFLALVAAARLGLRPNLPVRTADREFDAGAFLADAAAAGGIDAYAAAIARDLDASGPPLKSYRLQNVRRDGLAADVATFVGRNLASGVVSAIGGQAFGATLSALRDRVPTTQDVLDKLGNLESDIHNLQSDLNDLKLKMEENAAKGRYTTLENSGPYKLAIGANEPNVNEIRRLASRYSGPAAFASQTPIPGTAAGYALAETAGLPFAPGGLPAVGFKLAQATPTPAPSSSGPESKIANIIRNIQLNLVDPNAMMQWDLNLRNPAGGSNMIDEYNNIITADRFLSPDDSANIERWWEYMDAQQATSLYLITEFNRHENASTAADDNKELLRDWSNKRKAQFEKLRGGRKTSWSLDLSAAGLGTVTAQNGHTVPPIAVVKKGQNVWWFGQGRDVAKPDLVTWLGYAGAEQARLAGQAGLPASSLSLPSADQVRHLVDGLPGGATDIRLAGSGLPVWPGMAIWCRTTSMDGGPHVIWPAFLNDFTVYEGPVGGAQLTFVTPIQDAQKPFVD